MDGFCMFIVLNDIPNKLEPLLVQDLCAHSLKVNV
jgi:hypothetical protein